MVFVDVTMSKGWACLVGWQKDIIAVTGQRTYTGVGGKRSQK